MKSRIWLAGGLLAGTVAVAAARLCGRKVRTAADPSAGPAHALYVELATRITTQRLHYRSGDEETAAKSLHTLFQKTRELMTEYPAAREFQRVALALLNDTVRPYTARWHGWMTQEGDKVDKDGRPILKLHDEWLRRKFREELRELQPRLFGFQKTLKAMARGERAEIAWIDPKSSEALAAELEKQFATKGADLGDPLPLCIRPEVRLYGAGRERRDETKPIAREITEKETQAIRVRREVFGRPASLVADGFLQNATGLALSGGGIRSATFCLGVVQALQRRKMFPQFDYLSTVSGGGYLGSFLSCYLGADPDQLETAEAAVVRDRWADLGTDPTPRYTTLPAPHPRAQLDDLFGKKPTAPAAPETPASKSAEPAETEALRHLRNHSRYLLSGGAWGLLRIAQVFVVGFISSLLMLLTLPLFAAWLLRLLRWDETAEVLSQAVWLIEPLRAAIWTVPFSLAAMALGRWLIVSKAKSACRAPAGLAVFIMVLAIWIAAAIRTLGLAITSEPGWEAWARPSGIALAGSLAVLAGCSLLLPFAQRCAHGSPWDSTPSVLRSATETATLGLVFFAVFAGAVFFAPGLVVGYEQFGARMSKVLPRALDWKPPEWLAALLAGTVPAIFGLLVRRKDGSARTWAQWLFNLTMPFFFLLAFVIFASHLGVGGKVDAAGQPIGGWCRPAILSIGLVAWAWFLVNINAIAPHSYYRDRLCECYLALRGRRQRSWLKRILDSLLHGVANEGPHDRIAGIGSLQRLPLSALGARLGAPYHLLNATANAAASKDLELRGRNGDFFVFSRHFCGSPLTGYITTGDLERIDPHVDLGTAMAISGAAASTNMGWQTVSRLRFLMTLFNVRLGYWLPRPGKKPWPRPIEAPGPVYFFREMLGIVHEKARFVNLSDGGHIENLAVYELLRRQCKFIVAVDAGMEPKMECADLMRLQRYAAIDLGIRMHFDPTDLTLLPTSYSRAYAVLVKIDYAPPSESNGEKTSRKLGWMLYLKLAITGTEPRYVLDYRRQNPAFPHQTTADQFYDEAQFEAYRALGECAAESLFREEIVGATVPEEIEAWFQSLANSLLPDNDEAIKRRDSEEPSEEKHQDRSTTVAGAANVPESKT